MHGQGDEGWRTGLQFLRSTAPQAYFGLYNGAIVFFLPYLALYWKTELSFSGSQIGILAAVRPFICSVSGQLLTGFADARGAHLAVSLVTYIVAMATRSSMALVSAFVGHVVLVAVSEACQSPFSIITDAAIASTTTEAGYGKRRVWASVGWGALAPVSGWLVGQYGIRASFAVYLGLVSIGLIPTALLPFGALARRVPGAAPRGAPPRLARESAAPLLSADFGAAAMDDRAEGEDDADAGGCDAGCTGSGLESCQHGGGAAGAAIELASHSHAAPDADEVSYRGSSGPGPTSLLDGESSWTIPSYGARSAAAKSEEGAEEATVHSVAGAAHPSFVRYHADASSGGGPTPRGAMLGGGAFPWRPLLAGSGGSGGLERTTSLAPTEFFSVHSSNSGLVALGGLASPRDGTGPSALGLGMLSPRGSEGASPFGPALLSPRGAGAMAQGALLKQRSDASAIIGEDSVAEADLLQLGGPLSPAAPQAEAGPASASDGRPPGPAQLGVAGPSAGAGPLGIATSSVPVGAGGAGSPSAAGAGRALGRTASSRQLRRRASSRQLVPPLPAKPAPLLATAPGSGAVTVAGAGSKHGVRGQGAVAIRVDAGPPAGGRPGSGRAASAATDASSLSVWGGIKHVLSNPHGAAFFATAFNMGLGYGALGYLMITLRELGAPSMLLGLCLTVNTCGEVPVFWFQGTWLRRLGPELAFHVAMLAWIVRLGLYCLLPLFPTPWVVLLVEPLHGFTFGMAYGSGTVMCKRLAPSPHLRGSVQSMLFGLYYGVGPGISGMAGGLIMASMGLRAVFVTFALVCLGVWLATLACLWLATRRTRRLAAAAAVAEAWAWEI
eukprot:scaffold2.g7159.t1